MKELRDLVEDIVEYTRTWSISDFEWYGNIDSVRKSNLIANKHITEEEYERAIREDILYELVYNMDGIKRQMETDLTYGYEDEEFDKISRELEKKIQKLFKDFKIERYY